MSFVIALFFHSWLRWLIIGLAITSLVRTSVGLALRKPWSDTDQRIGRALVIAFDTQVTLGLLLYLALSPITPKSIDQLFAYMPVAQLRFFAIEHGTMMLLAVVTLHAGWVLTRRARSDKAKQRRFAITLAVTALLAASAIPWPTLPYGRPLFRLF